MLLGLDFHNKCRFENLEWNLLKKKADKNFLLTWKKCFAPWKAKRKVEETAVGFATPIKKSTLIFDCFSAGLDFVGFLTLLKYWYEEYHEQDF